MAFISRIYYFFLLIEKIILFNYLSFSKLTTAFFGDKLYLYFTEVVFNICLIAGICVILVV